VIGKRWCGLLGTVSVVLAMSACTSDSIGTPSITTADAYSAAIRWYLDGIAVTAPASTTGSKPVIVYVAPESGKAIGSQAQASVVRAMSDMTEVVTVRFADVRDDALDLESATKVVKDDGVLLLVGPVVEGPPPVDVDVTVYHDAGDDRAFSMRVTSSGGSFRATSVSEVGQG
jgi:hypothetical protein